MAGMEGIEPPVSWLTANGFAFKLHANKRDDSKTRNLDH